MIVSNASYTLRGAGVNSAGALALQNNATLVLSNASSFAGGTTVNGNLHLRAANNSLGALSVTSAARCTCTATLKRPPISPGLV